MDLSFIWPMKSLVLVFVAVLLTATIAFSQSAPGWKKLPKGARIELADAKGNYKQTTNRRIFYSASGTIDSVIDEALKKHRRLYTGFPYTQQKWAFAAVPNSVWDGQADGPMTMWMWDSAASRWDLRKSVRYTNEPRKRTIELVEIRSGDTMAFKEVFHYNERGYLERREQHFTPENVTVKEYFYTFDPQGQLSTMLESMSMEMDGQTFNRDTLQFVKYAWKDGAIDEMSWVGMGPFSSDSVVQVYTDLVWADRVIEDAPTLLMYATEHPFDFASEIAPRRTLLQANMAMSEPNSRDTALFRLSIASDSIAWETRYVYVEPTDLKKPAMQLFTTLFEDGCAEGIEAYVGGELRNGVKVQRTYDAQGNLAVQETSRFSMEGGLPRLVPLARFTYEY